MNIFYIIGVVVVIILVARYIGLTYANRRPARPMEMKVAALAGLQDRWLVIAG